jgi:cell pole-organizing protein PopZ
MTTRHTHSDKSIEDILQSIRNVINNRDHNKSHELSDEELHLTEMIEDELENSLFSEQSRAKTESILEDFIETATTLGIHKIEEDVAPKINHNPVEDFVMELLKPQIRRWLDAHLPVMVKQIVSEEIKLLVANIQRNKAH